MNGAYAPILAVEGVVVFAAGAVIAVVAARNPRVVLYAQSVALAGAGVAAGGVGAVLAASGFEAAAAVVVAIAALGFLAAGWQLSVDGVGRNELVDVPRGDAPGGFEEGRE